MASFPGQPKCPCQPYKIKGLSCIYRYVIILWLRYNNHSSVEIEDDHLIETSKKVLGLETECS